MSHREGPLLLWYTTQGFQMSRGQQQTQKEVKTATDQEYHKPALDTDTTGQFMVKAKAKEKDCAKYQEMGFHEEKSSETSKDVTSHSSST